MTPLALFEEFRFIWELLAANLLFLLPFAKRKKHFLPWMALGIPVLTGLSFIHFPLLELRAFLTGTLYHFAVASGYLLLTLGVMLLSLCCFHLTAGDAFYFCIAGYSAQHLVYVLVHELVARMVWPQLTGNLPLYVFVSLAACVILFIPIHLSFSPHLRQCGGQMFEGRPRHIISNLFLLTLMMLCTFSCQYLFDLVEGCQLLGIALGGMVCMMMLSIQYGALYAVRVGQERAVIEQMLRDSARHYSHSKELIEYVNRAVHDLKHTLRSMRQVGTEDRQRFIDEAESNIQEYQRLVYTDNEVLNTILAEKALACAHRQIRFSCSVDGARLDHISVPDLYALLGNAIDNAIECAEQFGAPEKRVISLTIRSQNGFTCLQTNNFCDTQPRRNDGLPVTTKADRANHGFGLKSIRYLAHKYGGSMCVSVEDHIFILQIIIPEPLP